MSLKTSSAVAFVLKEDHLRPLLQFVGKVTSKWRQIGLALGFQRNVLDVIQVEHRGRLLDCFTDLLSIRPLGDMPVPTHLSSVVSPPLKSTPTGTVQWDLLREVQSLSEPLTTAADLEAPAQATVNSDVPADRDPSCDDDAAGSQPRKVQDDGPLDWLRRRNPDPDIEKMFLPYSINKMKEKHGLALLIVNETFRKHPDHSEKKALAPRECGSIDRKNLKQLWTHLGYRVRVERNKTADEIKSIFENIQEDGNPTETIQQGDDSFVCCISSHGAWDPALGTDVVYGVEGAWVEEDCLLIKEGVEAIGTEETFEVKRDQVEKVCQVTIKGAVDIKNLAYREFSSLSCPKLKGKPKLFFIQACRGKKHPEIAADDDTTSKQKIFNPPRRLAQETDFLFAYATATGCKAYRDDGGSFFITYLCHYLKEYSNKLPLVPLLEVVSQQQAQANPFPITLPDKQEVETRQSPNFSSSLRGPVFFFDDVRKQYRNGMLSGLKIKYM